MTTKIFITGAGGPAAIGVMRALQCRDVDFYAGDMDANAAGLFDVPPSRRNIVFPGSDPRFVDHLLSLCREQQIDVLWPTVDSELMPIAERRADFESLGIRLVLPSRETLRVCLDKWVLVQRCESYVPCPQTSPYYVDSAARDFSGGCILKPRSGSGSRGIHRVLGVAQMEKLGELEGYIAQDFLPGEEYSVDTFVSENGRAEVAVPRLRSKVDSGVAVACETVRDPELMRMALRVARVIGLSGVANIQFRRDSSGLPSLLEVNPRVAGTMGLSVEAGVNFPALALDNAMGAQLPRHFSFREIAVVRSLQETYISREELRDLRAVKLSSWEPAWPLAASGC